MCFPCRVVASCIIARREWEQTLVLCDPQIIADRFPPLQALKMHICTLICRYHPSKKPFAKPFPHIPTIYSPTAKDGSWGEKHREHLHPFLRPPLLLFGRPL